MDLRKKVKALLSTSSLRPAEIDLRNDNGIIGVVVSKSFRGKDPIDRQTMVWNVLDEHLDPSERKEILVIVAVTPEEQIGHTTL